MILVAGATGMLGSMITQRLLADKRDVRVLVRPQSAYQPLVTAGAQPIVGDLKDPASLAAACQGVHTVITTANSAQRGGSDTVQTVDLEGNRNLIDAAARAGVGQFIFVSALGAGPDSPVPFLQAKGLTESRLRESGMTWTILEPNIYMDVWIPMIGGMPLQQGRPVLLIGEGRRKHAFVAAGDVAAFAIATVDHPAARNQTLVIGGPEPVSWRDIIAVMERVLGREIPVETLPIGEQLPGLPAAVSGMMAASETYDSPIDMRDTTQTFGIELTSLERWIEQAFSDMRAPVA